jgi:tetratricopeptide (TPR) repeat protein
MKRNSLYIITIAAILIILTTAGCTRELTRGGGQKIQPFSGGQASGMQGEPAIQGSGAGPDGLNGKSPLEQIPDETGGSTNPTVADLMKEGRVAMEQGKFDVAIEKFTKIIELEPSNSRALYNLGYSYRQAGDIDKAIEYSRKAADADPKQLGVHQNLGYAYEKKGEMDLASAEFEKELLNHPEEPKLASLSARLAKIYLDKGLMDEAFDAANRAVKLAPKDAANHAIMAQVHMKNKAYDSAVASLQQAAALAPTDAQYRKALGDALWEAGKKDDARKVYAEAIALDPSLKDKIDAERQPGGGTPEKKPDDKKGK